MRDAYTTIYLRLPFTVAAPAQVTTLSLEAFYDDGFIAYLNGQEIARSATVGGTPGTPLPYNATCANIYPEPTAYEAYDVTGRRDLLVAGTNWLAIHALNTNAPSSDFVISARVRGTVAGVPTLLLNSGASGVYFKGRTEPVPRGEEEEDTRHHTPGVRQRDPIVINELLAATPDPDSGDWIELYNRGAAPVTIGGMYLSDEPDDLDKYQIPLGEELAAGAHRVFTRTELGFGLSSLGETVFLTAADELRVVDAVKYGLQEYIDATHGRYPDGADEWYTMIDLSPGEPNAVELEDAVIINELMYHPVSEEDRDEYVELYNRGGAAVDLSGWRLSKAVDYAFPAGTSIGAGQYLVIAADPAHIAGKYGLGAALGPYTGVLSDGGESLRLRDQYGNVVDVVRYHDGGAWPEAADGEGSSLELIDPRDDNNVAAAWGASDESGKSAWTPFTRTAVFRQYWVGPESELHFFLQHRGEALVDNLKVVRGGTQHLQNGSFESGASGWIIEGTHVDSFVTTEGSADGSRSLHLVASGRGDTYCNRIEKDLSPALSVGQSYTVSGAALWLRGSKWLCVRTHGQGIAFTVELAIPARLGTPGVRNSVYAANRGPDVSEVRHRPIVPLPGEAVTVTARVSDGDGLASVALRYGVEGTGSYQTVAMQESGGPGSGLYSGTIPGQAANTLMAFYVEARDGLNAPGTFPPDAQAQQCLYQVGPNATSNFVMYRILTPGATRQALASRPRMSNHLLPCCFVYDDTEVYYMSSIRFRGSPFIRGEADPVYSKRALRLRLPSDQLFHGRSEINLDTMESGRNPSLQSERVAYWICRKAGIPWSQIQFTRVLVNQSDHGLYGDVQKVDEDYVDYWFPDDVGGYLYKIDDWFEFNDSGGFNNRDADLRLWGEDEETYRWNYRTRSRDHEDNFEPIIDMAISANLPDAQYRSAMLATFDLEEVLKEMAVRHIVGDWDSWGYNRGKNNLIYWRPSDGRFVLIPWDIDFVLGSGDGPTSSLSASSLFNFSRLFGEFGEEYGRISRAIARTTLGEGADNGYMDRTYSLLAQEGVGAADPSGIKSYLAARRNFMLGPAVAITTNGGQPLVTTDPDVLLAGAAPYDVASMTLNGAPVTPVWTSPTSWSLPGVLSYGVNDVRVECFDVDGASMGFDTTTITINPFIIHTLRPEKGGAYVEWYSIPQREYTLLAGDSPPVTQPIASELKAAGESLGFLDAGALGHARRFYAVVLEPAKVEPGLRGDYYSGMSFNTLLATRVDPVVDFYWGGGQPHPSVPADNFSIRWTGFVTVTVPGTYTFWTDSDDGVRLQIGNATIIDNWTDHGATWNWGSVALGADAHPLLLEFYENGGDAVMELEYEGPGIPRQTVPVSVLSHTPF